jgi:hypothetical protein
MTIKGVGAKSDLCRLSERTVKDEAQLSSERAAEAHALPTLADVAEG